MRGSWYWRTLGLGIAGVTSVGTSISESSLYFGQGTDYQMILTATKSGWPETRHRWADPKYPNSEPYLTAVVIKQVGKTKEELWENLKRFSFGNPEVGFNGDWIIPTGGKANLVLRYEFGFENGKVDRIYIKNSERGPSSLLSPDAFSWPNRVFAYTSNWHIGVAIKKAKESKDRQATSPLRFVLEAQLPNGSAMRHLVTAEDAVPRWLLFKDEFNPSTSRTAMTWSWRRPLQHMISMKTDGVLVASKDWWSRVEKRGERDIPWQVRSTDFVVDKEKIAVPIKFAAVGK